MDFVHVLGTGKRIERLPQDWQVSDAFKGEHFLEALAGCIDAPEYIPTGATEIFIPGRRSYIALSIER